MENDQDKHTGCYGGISNIEHRPEEYKIFPAPDGDPVRKSPFIHRKIKHINNFPVQEGSVTAFFRKYRCYRMEATFTENQSINGTVNNIAHCSGKYQGKTNDYSCWGVPTVQNDQVRTD